MLIIYAQHFAHHVFSRFYYLDILNVYAYNIYTQSISKLATQNNIAKKFLEK